MKLADLRKLAIRRRIRIRFALPGGLECVVNEHGVAEAPGLARRPDFDFETELAAVDMFVIEHVVSAKKSSPTRTVNRAELSAMLAPAATATAAAEEE